MVIVDEGEEGELEVELEVELDVVFSHLKF